MTLLVNSETFGATVVLQGVDPRSKGLTVQDPIGPGCGASYRACVHVCVSPVCAVVHLFIFLEPRFKEDFVKIDYFQSINSI